jgi:hypothetical protein
MIAQQHDDALARAVRIGPSRDPSSYSLELVPETGKALVWQSTTRLSNATLDSSAVAIPDGGRTVDTLSAYLGNNAGCVPEARAASAACRARRPCARTAR